MARTKRNITVTDTVVPQPGRGLRPVAHLRAHCSARYSFELFPPRDEAQQLTLESTLEKLLLLKPEYFSVTFGAGGSTFGPTLATVRALTVDYCTPCAPHLSCGARIAEIDTLLDTYRDLGVERIVALRGDHPERRGHRELKQAADLVAHIRRRLGDEIAVEVACYPEFHPESPDPESELRYFKNKVEAGASGALTQYFFNADAYFRFVDDAAALGITIPIVPGIMPVTNFARLARFSTLCGAEIPRWMLKRLEAYDNDGAAVRAFGEEVVTRLCERLLAGGAPGLHFYTLNRANATLKLWRNLGLPMARRRQSTPG